MHGPAAAQYATTFCAYKGKAFYWSAWIDGRLFPDIAWGYPEPLPEQPRLRGRICFYNERVDEIRVAGITRKHSP